MKKNLLLLTFLSLITFGAYAQRDNYTPKIGVGLSGGVAISTVASDYPTVGSVDLKFELPIQSTPLNLVFKTAFTYYISKNGYSTGFYYSTYGSSNYSVGSLACFVPLELGLKGYVSRSVFIEGDAGVSFNVNSQSLNYTNKKVAPIFSPGVGYTFPISSSQKHSVDVSLAYENRVETGGGFSQIALHGAFNFGI